MSAKDSKFNIANPNFSLEQQAGRSARTAHIDQVKVIEDKSTERLHLAAMEFDAIQVLENSLTDNSNVSIELWLEAKEKLDAYKKIEMNLRKLIVDKYFNNESGVIEVGDGKLKSTVKFNEKFDYQGFINQDPEEFNRLIGEGAIKQKIEYVYDKSCSPENYESIGEYITTKDAAPTLAYKENKEL